MANDFPTRIRALPEFDGPFDASERRAEHCQILFASYPAGTVIEPHAHETENCSVITRGQLILIVEDSARRFGPGEWYHLAPGQVHAARFEIPAAEIEFWCQPPRPAPRSQSAPGANSHFRSRRETRRFVSGLGSTARSHPSCQF